MEAKKFIKLWGGKAIWSYGSNTSRGVGILFSTVVNLKIESFNYDFEGRLLCVDVNLLNTKLRLINIYAPNLVDKYGMALWVEDGYPFSASDMQTFMDIQELGHYTKWLTHASSPVRAKANDIVMFAGSRVDLGMDCGHTNRVLPAEDFHTLWRRHWRHWVTGVGGHKRDGGFRPSEWGTPLGGSPKTRRATERLIRKGSVKIGEVGGSYLPGWWLWERS